MSKIKTLNLIKQFWKKSQSDLIFTQATALAYTTLLSLIPLLAMAFFLFKAFGGFEKLQEQIQPLIESNLAPSFSDKISTYLDEIMNKVHAGTVGVLGVLGFIVTTITTITTIEKSFNYIWGVKVPRTLARRIPTYWTMMTVGPLLVACSLMIGTKASLWLKNDPGLLSQILSQVFKILPLFTSGLFFTLLFFFVPNVRVKLRDAAFSGLITGVVFEIAKTLYSIYAKNTISHDAIYGTLIIIPVFLVWLYLLWVIVLFGAEFCFYLQFKRLGLKYQFGIDERLSPFILSDILEELSLKSHNERGGMQEEELQAKLQLPYHELSAHLRFLEAEKWVVESRGRYFIGAPLETLDMPKLLSRLDKHRYVPKGKTGVRIRENMKSLWEKPKHS